jgi:hypothetical protein
MHRPSFLVAAVAIALAAYAAGHWAGNNASQCATAGEKNRFGYRTWYLGADLGGTNFRVQLYMVGAGQLRGEPASRPHSAAARCLSVPPAIGSGGMACAGDP